MNRRLILATSPLWVAVLFACQLRQQTSPTPLVQAVSALKPVKPGVVLPRADGHPFLGAPPFGKVHDFKVKDTVSVWDPFANGNLDCSTGAILDGPHQGSYEDPSYIYQVCCMMNGDPFLNSPCSQGTPTPAPTPTPTPTPAPTFTVSIDGQMISDQSTSSSTVVNNIIPLIRISFGSTVDKSVLNNVRLQFSTRADGTTPLFQPDHLLFDPNEKSVYYEIPFDDRSILYAGDQTLTVTYTDPSGLVTTKTYPFSIGDKTLVAGVPGVDTAVASAYHVSSLVEDNGIVQIPQGKLLKHPLPAPYNDKTKYAALTLSPLTFLKYVSKTNVKKWVVPAKEMYIVVKKSKLQDVEKLIKEARTAAVPGMGAALSEVLTALGAVYVLLDSVSDSPQTFVNDAHNFVLLTPRGIIETDDDTWKSIAGYLQKNSNQTLTKSLLESAVMSYSENKEKEYEIWGKASGDIFQGADLLYMNNEVLYSIYIESGKGSGILRIVTAKVPGNWGQQTVWPSYSIAKNWQWSDAAKDFMRYRPDYNLPISKRRIWGLNWKISYPFHVAGSIKDNEKPYYVGSSSFYNDIDLGSSHAVYDFDGKPGRGKLIAALLPNFRNDVADGLMTHWAEKKKELGMPFASEQEYLKAAQNILHGNHINADSQLFFRRTYYPEYPSQIGDICVFEKPNYEVVWGNDGFIRTFHVKSGGLKTFLENKADEQKSPY